MSHQIAQHGQQAMSNQSNRYIVAPEEPILITGATGFIGSRVVESLLELGFRNLRCFVRPSSSAERIEALHQRSRSGARIEVIRGNLLSREDCGVAVNDVRVIYHLAAGTGGKSFPEAVMNAYCYGKVKQDELVMRYGQEYGIPYVIVRPGYVYGPGKQAISGRVGIDTFGFFLHLGGSNKLPLTYVDNCAEAIVLAGLRDGIDGEILNIVDDELPSSRQFLRLYKKNVRRFPSYYLPHFLSYSFCWLWEWYSKRSQGQLPLAFNRKRWYVDWKSTAYSNDKLKELVGWRPRVSLAEGLRSYFEGCRRGGTNA